ncbi:MAG TPA: hypothetical protein QGH10_16010 [Armatimonadota bacterium]|nr:hypothetical protein [Armatimonadota bacterium]
MLMIATVAGPLLLASCGAQDGPVGVAVVSGPTVLHANTCDHWGGHTYPYVVQGERHVFWTATLHEPEERADGEKKYPTQVVGQYPLPGTGGRPAIHTITVEDPDLFYAVEPMLFRTPDGYLHMLVGSYHSTDDPLFTPGRIRYYRSARPEDVTEWVERTELIALTDIYKSFHLRMNVAVTPDGERAVIAVLAISPGGDPVPWNTPLILRGRRDGLDFRFEEPFKYHDPIPFFYPQVAALPAGIVMTGEVWHELEDTSSLLLHLDWEGNVLHEETLPSADEKGTHFAYDLRPLEPGEWGRLGIYQRSVPEEGTPSHQFLTYDVAARELKVVQNTPVEIGFSNFGKWLHISPERSVFINNPMQGQYYAWEGDILGGGEITKYPLPRTNPLELGYLNSGSALIPTPLNGSVATPGTTYLVSDASEPGRDWEGRGPQSLLLWELKLGDQDPSEEGHAPDPHVGCRLATHLRPGGVRARERRPREAVRSASPAQLPAYKERPSRPHPAHRRRVHDHRGGPVLDQADHGRLV